MKKILATAVLMMFVLVGCDGRETTSAPTPTDPTPQATLVSISVTPSNPTIMVGATQQFIAIGAYSDSTTQNLTVSATWSSPDTGKATISSGGLATAVTTGLVTITATSGSVSGTATLTVVTVTSPPAPYTAPSGWSLSQVTTDGASIITTGSNVSGATAIAFNSDGTIKWQKSEPGTYGKSKATGDYTYVTRTYQTGIDYNSSTSIEKINNLTGEIVSTVVVGTQTDPNGAAASYLGSFATSTNAVYVAGSDGNGSTIKISKLDLSLTNKTFLLGYKSSDLRDMGTVERSTSFGNYFYSISSGSIDAYTLDGVYFGYTLALPGAEFVNTLHKGNVQYVSGLQAGTAYVWVYKDGDLQNSFPLGTGSAEGMDFGPDGEMYVAISGGVGPVRIDHTTGTIAWTGTTAGHSVAYLNGKIYVATGGNKIEVFDAITGGKIN
ncbi:MAG: Ig-like domain-containing protein [Patescibacteria group bacterium]